MKQTDKEIDLYLRELGAYLWIGLVILIVGVVLQVIVGDVGMIVGLIIKYQLPEEGEKTFSGSCFSNILRRLHKTAGRFCVRIGIAPLGGNSLLKS